MTQDEKPKEEIVETPVEEPKEEAPAVENEEEESETEEEPEKEPEPKPEEDLKEQLSIISEVRKELANAYTRDKENTKTIEMLYDAAPGNNFLMGISEGFPSFQHMLKFVPTILKTINKFGKYPIRKV